jgi:hypothetical protein
VDGGGTLLVAALFEHGLHLWQNGRGHGNFAELGWLAVGVGCLSILVLRCLVRLTILLGLTHVELLDALSADAIIGTQVFNLGGIQVHSLKHSQLLYRLTHQALRTAHGLQDGWVGVGVVVGVGVRASDYH